MNVLVLEPAPRSLSYACYGAPPAEPTVTGRVDGFRGHDSSRAALAAVCDALGRSGAPPRPDLVAMRVVHGGEVFSEHLIATPEVLKRLAAQVPEAPLHLPIALALAEACADLFTGTPVALVFETAFFVGLPARERLYALDPEAAGGLRRYGFHGILHEAACAHVAGRRRPPDGAAPRILSVCLAPRPELAAVIGAQPVMVTGGATPLEGLPGETTCGEIDPALVTVLARRLRWSPEQIDAVLTRESGLAGLVGRPVTLPEVLQSDAADVAAARGVFRHRLLLAVGAGVAAMGDLDAVVFCGPYARVGETLVQWLQGLCTAPRTGPVPVDIFPDPRSRVIAEAALAALVADRAGPDFLAFPVKAW